jgi:hypothetical protein
MTDHICAKCGGIGFHYDEKLRGFTCQLDLDGKLRPIYDENGNEKI